MEPKILNMKVWAIGEKPVFYGYDDEDSVYSIIDKTIVDKPSHIGLMSSRDLEPADLSDVMLHDQMSTEDYECLMEKEMIPEELQALFAKVQDLRKQIEAMQNAEPVEKAAEDEVEGDRLSKTAIDALINMVRTGVLASDGSVFEQLVQGAEGLTEQEQKVLNLVKEHLLSTF